MESAKCTHDGSQNSKEKPGRKFAGSHGRGKGKAAVHGMEFVADGPEGVVEACPLDNWVSQVWHTRGRRLRYEILPLARQL